MNLYPHQREALKFLAQREQPNASNLVQGGFLSMLMGLGKTLTMLQHVVDTRTSSSGPTLVVCPKTALFTWEQEIQKFFADRIKVLKFRKDGPVSIKTLTKDQLNTYDVVLTNFEYIRQYVSSIKLAEKLVEIHVADEGEGAINQSYNAPAEPLLKDTVGENLLFSVKWHRIVADESHNFSNFKSNLFKAMMCFSADKKWCLTGTPIRNYSDDLYAQFKFLGYRDEFLSPVVFENTHGNNVLKYIHYVDYVRANVDLPECIESIIKVMLDEKQAQAYNYYEDAARAAFQEWVAGCKNFSVVLTMFLRLRQACVAPYIITPQSARDFKPSQEIMDYAHHQGLLEETSPGFVSWLNNRDTTSGVEAAKINEAVRLITTVIPNEDKVVVFTMFPRASDLIKTRLQALNVPASQIDGDVAGDARDQALRAFKTNDVGLTRVLIVTYKTGSESLNLTEANHAILLEPWWCPAVMQQAKARIHRMGQTKPTHIYELIVAHPTEGKNTIEQKIVDICKKKVEDAELTLSGNNKRQLKRQRDSDDDVVCLGERTGAPRIKTESTGALDSDMLRNILY
jgi:transcription termination factor 2